MNTCAGLLTCSQTIAISTAACLYTVFQKTSHLWLALTSKYSSISIGLAVVLLRKETVSDGLLFHLS